MLPSTKSWYIHQLKQLGINDSDGRKLSKLKTHELATLYHSNKNN